MWEVEVTDQFIDWWEDLSLEQQAALEARIELLAEQGPRGADPRWSGWPLKLDSRLRRRRRPAGSPAFRGLTRRIQDS